MIVVFQGIAGDHERVTRAALLFLKNEIYAHPFHRRAHVVGFVSNDGVHIART